MDDDGTLKIQIRTALNTGQRPGDIARQFNVPLRTVTTLAKSRHRLRETHMLEAGGKIMHNATVLERWDERPERQEDFRRRETARVALEQTLKKFGLAPRDDSIAITPGEVPSHGSWRRKARRRVKT